MSVSDKTRVRGDSGKRREYSRWTKSWNRKFRMKSSGTEKMGLIKYYRNTLRQ